MYFYTYMEVKRLSSLQEYISERRAHLPKSLLTHEKNKPEGNDRYDAYCYL